MLSKVSSIFRYEISKFAVKTRQGCMVSARCVRKDVRGCMGAYLLTKKNVCIIVHILICYVYNMYKEVSAPFPYSAQGFVVIASYVNKMHGMRCMGWVHREQFSVPV